MYYMHQTRWWVFFKSGDLVGVFPRKVKKIRPLEFLSNVFGLLKFFQRIFRPLKENEWSIQAHGLHDGGKLRENFTPIKFSEKSFASLDFLLKISHPLKTLQPGIRT